jgi:hypothetical protein
MSSHVTLYFSMITLGSIIFSIGIDTMQNDRYIKNLSGYSTLTYSFYRTNRQSFTMHLLRLMTSWAVVCDVWYLEPQYLQPGETAIEFAERY